MPYQYPFQERDPALGDGDLSLTEMSHVFPRFLSPLLALLNIRQNCFSGNADPIPQTESISNSETSDGDIRCLEENQQLRSICEDLEKKLANLEKVAAISIKAQTCADEELRQGESLEDASQSDDTIHNTHNNPDNKSTELEMAAEHFGDDGVRQLCDKIYQRFESWLQRHYFQAPSSPGSKYFDTDPENLEIFLGIYGDISRHIFSAILAWHMIGSDGRPADYSFRALDREVQKVCPKHVWQNWRSATSQAVLSLNTNFVETQISRLVNLFERNYSSYATTDIRSRISELKSLLNEFIQFKIQLELQDEIYEFRWFISNMPARENTMTSFTAECPPIGFVEHCLFPALFKKVSGCEDTIVRKALVKTFQPLSLG